MRCTVHKATTLKPHWVCVRKVRRKVEVERVVGYLKIPKTFIISWWLSRHYKL